MPGKITILTAKGVFRGNGDSKVQYYQVVGLDADKNQYVMTFACELIYQESIEKALSRFFPIEAPAKEIKEQLEMELEDRQNDGNGDEQLTVQKH